MSLNKIDFSDGIRPEEIQENFEMLQEQINRERLSVGGYGISSGFEITPIVRDDVFAINVSAASIIDEDGNELFIDECQLNVEPPELYNAYESCTINYNNTISLKQIPYAKNRRMPAEYLLSKEPSVSGIYINYPSNSIGTDDYIRVSDIKGTILTVTGAISRDVVVRYTYTADRIDTVYLKEDNTVAIIRGTTSTTPSKAYMPADGKLLIGYIMIESSYVNENITIPQAHIYVKEDMRSLRNLYTDGGNNLWICGTLFDDLQIIHMKEPKNPKKNALWLNSETNTLFCWKSTDGFTYSNKIEIDTDFVNNQNANRDFATYMDFLLGENELEIYHNGNKLIHNIHYYELYNEIPTYYQNIPSDAEGNSFRIIEDKESGNGLTLKAGDTLTYMINFKDSHYMWVPVNKMSYVNAKEIATYCTNDYMPDHKNGYFDPNNIKTKNMGVDPITQYHYKYQYFIFDREKELNMHFTPNRNELSVHINQMVLHSDQFEEITVYDLLDTLSNPKNNDNKVPEKVAINAAIYYGWTRDYLSNAANDFDNTGIGFKLIDPLDNGLNSEGHSYLEEDGSNDLYVEAIVERRICDSPSKRKLQRTATFVAEETIKVDEAIKANGIIQLEGDNHYRYNENQLEVFVDGKRLLGPSAVMRDADIIEQYGYYLPSIEEGIDDVIIEPIDGSGIVDENGKEQDPQSFFERKRAAVCTMFKINPDRINLGNIITYKITTNVYSYDHINDIITSLEKRVGGNVTNMTIMTQQLESHKAEINERVSDMEIEVQRLRDDVLNKEGQGIDELTVLSMSNMPLEIVNTMVMSLEHINTSFMYTGAANYVVPSIREKDYLTVVKRDVNTGADRFLIPDIDYSVVNSLSGTTGTMIFNNNVDKDWNHGDTIYITGIKFGKVGR